MTRTEIFEAAAENLCQTDNTWINYRGCCSAIRTLLVDGLGKHQREKAIKLLAHVFEFDCSEYAWGDPHIGSPKEREQMYQERSLALLFAAEFYRRPKRKSFKRKATKK